MSNEVTRYGGGLIPTPRPAARAVARIAGDVHVEQATLRAKARVGEFAVNEVTYLKAVQREIETRNPDAADAVALIINTTVQSMARSVAQFCNELD
jgi:hypothetical protein